MRRVVACVLASGLGCGSGKRETARERVGDAALPADARSAVDAGDVAHGVEPPAGPYTGPVCDARFAPRPDRDPAPVCFAPGGTFVMGTDDGEPHEGPARRVTVSPYFIDQFEVTRAQFVRFLQGEHGLRCDEINPSLCGRTDITFSSRSPWQLDVAEDGRPHEWNGDVFRGGRLTFFLRDGDGPLPMVDIGFAAARAYCRWAGKDLPSHAQWEYAARVEPLTGALRRYPWGDRFSRGITNCAEETCQDGVVGTAPVDELPRDVSAIGVRGLGGNAMEWVLGCGTPRIEECGDCVDPVGKVDCEPRRDGDVVSDGWSVRGAGFFNTLELLDVVRRYARAQATDPLVGFRCATAARGRATRTLR